MKKKMEISLLGQRFTIRSDQDDKTVSELVRIVTDEIEELRARSRSISTHHLGLLAAFNLAERLLKKEDTLNQLRFELREKTDDALKKIETMLAVLPKRATHAPEVQLEQQDAN